MTTVFYQKRQSAITQPAHQENIAINALVSTSMDIVVIDMYENGFVFIKPLTQVIKEM